MKAFAYAGSFLCLTILGSVKVAAVAVTAVNVSVSGNYERDPVSLRFKPVVTSSSAWIEDVTGSSWRADRLVEFNGGISFVGMFSPGTTTWDVWGNVSVFSFRGEYLGSGGLAFTAQGNSSGAGGSAFGGAGGTPPFWALDTWRSQMGGSVTTPDLNDETTWSWRMFGSLDWDGGEWSVPVEVPDSGSAFWLTAPVVALLGLWTKHRRLRAAMGSVTFETMKRKRSKCGFDATPRTPAHPCAPICDPSI